MFDTETDFWSKIDIQDKNECWNWLAGKDSDGYGAFWYQKKQWKAHRLAYLLYYGSILDNMQVLHDPVACHNKACCNPAHLRLGTNAENHHDSDIAKINWDIVHEIRDTYQYHGVNNAVFLAHKFNISDAFVLDIVHNRVWKE